MHPGQLHLAIPRWVGAVSTSRQHRKLGTSEQAHRVMHELRAWYRSLRPKTGRCV